MKYTSSQPRHVRRPRNAFFIYKHDLYEFLRQEGHEISNQMVFNTLAGKLWRELTPIEQGVYYEKADQEKREHESKHPDYRYRPTHGENPRKGKDRLRGLRNTVAFSKSGIPPELMGRLQEHSEYDVAVDTPQPQGISPMDPGAAPSVQAAPCCSNPTTKATASFSPSDDSGPFAPIVADPLPGVCGYDDVLVSIIEECYLHFMGSSVAATSEFQTSYNNLSVDPVEVGGTYLDEEGMDGRSGGRATGRS